MPSFLPFPGIRYDTGRFGDDLSDLVAPPYDVIDDHERVGFEARHGRNAVRLILPTDEAAEGDRYAVAARAFAHWRDEGTLACDAGDAFYVYRMEFRGPHGEARHTTGVIGALVLPDAEPPDAAPTLPHERTLPKAKSDRLALLEAMRANLDPIWGLSLATGLTHLLDGAAPLARAHDDDGVTHHLGAITDPGQVAAIRAHIGTRPMVLADGHHRFETAGNYLRSRPDPGADRGAQAIMCFVVELSDDELCIQPIHRIVTPPPGVDVRAALGAAFAVVPVDADGSDAPEAIAALEAAMDERGGIGIADAHGLAVAVAHSGQAAAALQREPAAVRDLDSALVESLVVPALGDARWTYRHGAAECAAIARANPPQAAILLRSPTVAQTRRVAEAGERMPQKTTFFYPKPRTGMVFRSLDA